MVVGLLTYFATGFAKAGSGFDSWSVAAKDGRVLPANAIGHPSIFWIGNMSRSLNLSYGLYLPFTVNPASVISSNVKFSDLLVSQVKRDLPLSPWID